MPKTTIDIDQVKYIRVKEILGTDTLRDTVDAAFDTVIRRTAIRAMVERAKEGAFADLLDPEIVKQMWS